MNPIYVILLFVVLLGALLYYLQSRENSEQEIVPKAKSSDVSEKKVVKADDYQAQYEREKLTEQPGADTETESFKDKPDEDIATLDGIGPKYMELLLAAGYTSIKSIAESNPEELYNKLIETNNRTHLTKRPPIQGNIEEWIKAAGSKQA